MCGHESLVAWQRNPLYSHPAFGCHRGEHTYFTRLCADALDFWARVNSVRDNGSGARQYDRAISRRRDNGGPLQLSHLQKLTLDRCYTYLTRLKAELNADDQLDTCRFAATFCSVFRDMDDLKLLCEYDSAAGGDVFDAEDTTNPICTFLRNLGFGQFGNSDAFGINSAKKLTFSFPRRAKKSNNDFDKGVTVQITMYEREPTFTTFKPLIKAEHKSDKDCEPTISLTTNGLMSHNEVNLALNDSVNSDTKLVTEDEIKWTEERKCSETQKGKSFDIDSNSIDFGSSSSTDETVKEFTTNREFSYLRERNIEKEIPVVLPTVQEDNEVSGDSVSSDVEYWKRDIFFSALDEEEALTSVEQV